LGNLPINQSPDAKAVFRQEKCFMRKYSCQYCSHIYDEALGDPDSGIAPGTKFEDIPDDWMCPECGAEKSAYELIED
tara:strand:- start:273 stop:503 length:231 start_codon:yes stop_codon:yes gene_type:complete